MATSIPAGDCIVCVDCESVKATVKLLCGKHLICLSCLMNRGTGQPEGALNCTLSHEEKQQSTPNYPHPYGSTASVPQPEVSVTEVHGTEMQTMDDCSSEPGIRIFVDDSSIWIEAKKIQSKRKGFKTGEDHRVRIDMGKLADAVADGRPVEKGKLYGTEPPPIDTVWRKIQEKGFEIEKHPRSTVTGKAKLIHTQLVADVTELAFQTPVDERGTIVLVTGDADVIPAIEKVLKGERWKMEVHMWNQAISGQLKKVADESKGRVEIKPLDDCLDKLAFTEMRISNKRIRQRAHSCGVVFTMEPGAFENRVPTDDWVHRIEAIAQWPCQYYWYGRNGTQTDDLVIMFKPDSEDKKFDITEFLTLIISQDSENESKYQIPFIRNVQPFQQFYAKENKEEKDPAVQEFDDVFEQVGILDIDDVFQAGCDHGSMNDASSENFETDDNKFREVKKKIRPSRQRYTERCLFKFNCINGTRCHKKHSEHEIRYFKQRRQGQGNPIRKTKPCIFFDAGKCTKKKEDCEYAHGHSDGWCSKCITEGHFQQFCPKTVHSAL